MARRFYPITASCAVCGKETDHTGGEVYLDAEPITEDGTYIFDSTFGHRYVCSICYLELIKKHGDNLPLNPVALHAFIAINKNSTKESQ